MGDNLLFYLLRAMGMCKKKRYRKVNAPDDMVAVHVDMEFVFERQEIRFIKRFAEEQMVYDRYTDKVMEMCNELNKMINS